MTSLHLVARHLPLLRLSPLHGAALQTIPHCWHAVGSADRSTSSQRKHCETQTRQLHSTQSPHVLSASSAPSTTSSSCWQCHQPLASSSSPPATTIFCAACKSLQPPPDDTSSLNIYDLFNIKNSFTIDRKALDTSYRQYQRQLHPDRFGQQSAQLQQYSADWSSMVNAAYSTLCDSYLRAIYLLALNGIEWEKQPSTLTSSSDLMEVMELREEIDDAAGSKDWAKLDALQSTNNDKMLTIERELQARTHLDQHSARLSKQDIEAALPLVAKLSYCKQIADAIHQHLPSR